jgi:hypothetical protein
MGKDKSGSPKRPPSAYVLYSVEKRPEIKEANPSLKLGEISKMIGASWQGLSTAEKKPYEERAAKQKAAYQANKGSSSKSGKSKKGLRGKSKKEASSSESDDE